MKPYINTYFLFHTGRNVPRDWGETVAGALISFRERLEKGEIWPDATKEMVTQVVNIPFPENERLPNLPPKRWRFGQKNADWKKLGLPNFIKIIMSSYSVGSYASTPSYRTQARTLYKLQRQVANVVWKNDCWVMCVRDSIIPVKRELVEVGVGRTMLASLAQRTAVDVPDVDWADLSTRTLSSANSAAYDLATELAESHDTVRYAKQLVGRTQKAIERLASLWKRMRSPKREIKRWVKILRKRKYRSKREALQLVGQAPKGLRYAAAYWLEYNYAIRPLMYSWVDIHNALYQSTSLLFQKFGDKMEFQDMKTVENGPVLAVANHKRKARTFIRQSIDGGNSHTRIKLWVPGAIWEGITLSFVVDWFIGIGDYLHALRPFIGHEQVGGRSDKSEYTLNCTYSDAGRSVNFDKILTPATESQRPVGISEYLWEVEPVDFTCLTIEQRVYNRICPGGLVAPTVKIRTLLGWRRELSGLALLVSSSFNHFRKRG